MAFRKKVTWGGISFLIGIFSAAIGWSFYKTLTGFILVLLVLCFYLYSQRKIDSRNWPAKIFGFLAILVLFIGGALYYHFYLNFKNQNQEITYNQKITFLGVVAKNPENRENYQKLLINLEPPLRGQVTILTTPLTPYRYGNLLEVTGSIEKSQIPSQSPISAFPTITLKKANHGFWLKTNLYNFKNTLTGQFKTQLNSDEAALLSGITFGERSEFTPKLKEAMARSGVTHIVALSGYNIAILVIAIERLLKKFLDRKIRFVLTLVIVFLFVLMVGGEASVVRAAIMGSLVLIAQQIGRPHDTLYLIIITALAMVLFNPTILVFDIGFQLSFLSLLGIIYLEPIFKKHFRVKNNEESLLSWRENGLTSLAAQLAVIPILVINFDQFSFTAILANILILTTVPLTMLLGFLFVGLNSIAYFLGFLLAKILGLLTFYQITIINLFSAMYLPIPGTNFLKNPLVFIIYYGLLAWFALYKNEKSRDNSHN